MHRTTTGPVTDTHEDAERPIVAMGASAGGLHALDEVLAHLPADLPAAVLVCEHVDRHHVSHLGTILARRSSLDVREATAGEHPRVGTVRVAPSGHDLTVTPGGGLAVTPCDDQQLTCPSVDRLFTSVAAARGPRAVAVVLSGTGTDGAKGVVSVKDAGGVVVVEDDSTAAFGGMPDAARRTGCADLVLPLAEIGPALTRLIVRGQVA